MTKRKYYIKQRFNPQLGTYYVMEGQLTKKQVKEKENPVYGENILHPFDTFEEYNQRCRELDLID